MSAIPQDAKTPPSVLVVGGGLVGLCCAHFLSERGANVTLLEAGSVGGGASRGNLGEIVPNLVAPLSTPGILRESALSVFDSDSALFVHPRLSREMARFLVRFVRSTGSRTFRRSAAQLQALARDTFDLFDELERGGLSLGRNTSGFLYTFRTLAAARKSLAAQHAIAGTRAELLSGREVRALEPNLSEHVVAGYVVEDQWSLDPGAFVDQLAGRLRRHSVAIVESARATSIRTGKDSVKVTTDRGTYEAETCVVAAGVWSRDLCRSLGLDLDIVAGKGYSFTVDLPRPLTRTVQFTDAHVVATPLGEHVRVAGTMELDRRREHFSPERITSIIKAADPYLTGVDWTTRRNEWVGPRPMTGDGLPLIGRLPGEPRVVVAAGHNMHGLTLGPVTGRLVARLVTEPKTWAFGNPFDPALNKRARRFPGR
jgi:D-amino-acid dehydrogenase